MEVALVMFKSDGSRRDFPLSGSRTLLGRTNACDLRIPLSSVSRKHCELLIEADTVIVRDLGSSNGTFHNGSRVQESELSPGDQIGVGPVRFTVVVNGKPEKIQPVPTILETHHSDDSADGSIAAAMNAAASSAEASDDALSETLQHSAEDLKIDLE